MRAHLAAGEIPDPYTTSYEICEKILEEHCDIIKNTKLFLSLSTDEDAAGNIFRGSNLTKLLELLPQRVRN